MFVVCEMSFNCNSLFKNDYSFNSIFTTRNKIILYSFEIIMGNYIAVKILELKFTCILNALTAVPTKYF